jgi:uncharacterized protein (DUF427 family)
MMSPGIQKHPEHKLQTERLQARVEIYLEGEQIADTNNAIRLYETGHGPVIYIPKNDLKNIDLLKFDDYLCPFKGHAELYSVVHENHRIENAAWSFDRPFDEFLELTGRVGFYEDKVDEIRIKN